MINILMSGCNGKMGQVITRLSEEKNDLKIVAGFDLNDSIKNSFPVFNNINKCDIKADVIIDFSNPAALDSVLGYAIAKNIPLVMATTGLSQLNISSLETASKQIPVFLSSNMSLGVNLLIDLVKKAAKKLQYNFDIEIIEKHHNQKLDAPSGTALTIADSINSVLDSKAEYTYDRHSKRKKRSKNEIGIHAIRGGTIVGDHSVIFAGTYELIEIHHCAMSKDIFAVGALKAAEFIFGKKPGLYSMKDIIGDD